jgi:two-component system sporulation sensor kinase B
LEKENKNELVDEIKKSCNFTFDMINTLLNTYKYEKGYTVLNYETFKLEDSILANSSNFIPSILEKGLRISYQLDSQVDIQADKKGLEKVFLILLSVAILNANRNSLINITTKKNKEEVEISIIYKGRFLTEEEYNRIYFKNPRFSTVGHGIKMNFCKKIIDFHKGCFSIKKNKCGLNSFSFSIPINKRKRFSFASMSLF